MGSFLGCKIVGLGELVQRYLGLALIPQAGVAIGLAELGPVEPARGDQVRYCSDRGYQYEQKHRKINELGGGIRHQGCQGRQDIGKDTVIYQCIQKDDREDRHKGRVYIHQKSHEPTHRLLPPAQIPYRQQGVLPHRTHRRQRIPR